MATFCSADRRFPAHRSPRVLGDEVRQDREHHGLLHGEVDLAEVVLVLRDVVAGLVVRVPRRELDGDAHRAELGLVAVEPLLERLVGGLVVVADDAPLHPAEGHGLVLREEVGHEVEQALDLGDPGRRPGRDAGLLGTRGHRGLSAS
jgi:hypothetical protein